MKNSIVILAIAVSVIFVSCKGNPQGAMGANDKADTSAFDKENEGVGRPEATNKDTTNKNIGPAHDKAHVSDSEDKKKHR